MIDLHYYYYYKWNTINQKSPKQRWEKKKENEIFWS
jgi:hypothetical protein